MAIDTVNKRRSAGCQNPWHIVYPLANGDVSASDRAHVSPRYRGLDYSTVAVKNYYCGGLANAGRLRRGLGFY